MHTEEELLFVEQWDCEYSVKKFGPHDISLQVQSAHTIEILHNNYLCHLQYLDSAINQLCASVKLGLRDGGDSGRDEVRYTQS